MRKSTALLGSYIPLVVAAHHGGRQRPTAVLLRTSWTTDHAGAANGIAQAWHNPRNTNPSCHYVVDESTVLRCVPDKTQADVTMQSHKGAISINVCHDPPLFPQSTTVSLAAQLTARLCKLYRIPVRILDDAECERWIARKRRSRGGIILSTTGPFPKDVFFTLVQDHAKAFDRKD